MIVEIAVTLEEAPGRGWIAYAPEIRATAQGASEQEALDNLMEAVRTYPEALAELSSASKRHVVLQPIELAS